MVHGREAAERSAETARKTFEEGATADTLPTIEVSSSELTTGMGILTLLVQAGFAASNGEARRHIKGGAIKVNDAPVTDEQATIHASDLGTDGAIKLSMGKKKHILVKVG